MFSKQILKLEDLTSNTNFTFAQNKFPIITDSIEYKQFKTPKFQKDTNKFFYNTQTDLSELEISEENELLLHEESKSEEKLSTNKDQESSIPYTVKEKFKSSEKQIREMYEYDYSSGND